MFFKKYAMYPILIIVAFKDFNKHEMGWSSDG